MKHKQLKWMLCIMALLFGSMSYAQVKMKPGGVSGAKLWLRTDIDLLLTLSGANLTTWGDASGYRDSTSKRNDALASTSTYAQYVKPADTIQNGIPYLDFRTGRNINYSSQLDFNYKSMFWVGSYNLTLNGDVARSFSWLDRNENPTGSSTERSFYLNAVPNYYINGGMTIPAGPPARYAPYYRYMGNGGNYYNSVRVRARKGMTVHHGFFYKTDDSNIYSTLNGTVIWWTKEHPVQHIWAPVDGRIILGGYVGSGGKTSITTDYRGTMSEFIGFDRELNLDEVQRVESYIAMKFGMSMVGYTKTFGSDHPMQDDVNRPGRDYKLSDGTVIWPGMSDLSLSRYDAYMHFLVRDDTSALNITKSTPAQTFNQRLSNYNTAVMYLDNNVTIAVGDNVNVPGNIATDKSYVVMGGFSSYSTFAGGSIVGGATRDTVCTGTPYTSTTRVVNGKTYQTWDRTYRVKSSGVPKISMKIIPTKTAWNQVATGGNKRSWGLNSDAWKAMYGANPGVLVVNGDGTSSFVRGQVYDGTMRVNAINVPADGMLYVCFDSNEAPVTINQGNQVLCNTGSTFTFTAQPAGGSWSATAPGGIFAPSGKATGNYAVTYTVGKMTASVNVEVVSATPTATLNTPSNTNVNNGETFTLEVLSTTNAGKSPFYSFAVGAGQYTTPSASPSFVVKGSDLATGSNTLNVKVIPQVTNGSCPPTSVTASKVVTKVDAAPRNMPGGVLSPAYWVRADKLEQTENILDINNNVIGTKVLKLKDLSPNAMSVTATVSGDTVAPLLASDWGANGTPAIVFNSKSLMKTSVAKDYKAFFLVNTFTAAEQAFVRNTPMTQITSNVLTANNPTRFFALHPYSNLSWNGGASTSEQRLYAFGQGWGYENTVLNSSFWVDQQTAQTFMEKKGTGLPMLNHFVMRDANNKFVWGINGAGVWEYKRSGNLAVPGNPKATEVVTYTWNGKLVLGGARVLGGSFTDMFNGKIAEVIAYDRILTPKEVNKIESYLGMRYGFSLRGYNADNAEATLSDFRDYELSDGTLVYPAASDASLQPYYADVNFLVRDDASMLYVTKNTPLSHGVQFLIPDLTGTNGTVSTFTKVTNETRSGFVRKAGNITAVVGSSIDTPDSIRVDKAYFAMGKLQDCHNAIEPITIAGVPFSKVWDASFKMKTSGISKVSLKVAPMDSWGEGFGNGCGIVMVTPNQTTFIDGKIVNGNMIVEGLTPIDGAEMYVILANTKLPVNLKRAVCQNEVLNLSDADGGRGTYVGNGIVNNVFTAANANLGPNEVVYTQGSLRYDITLKVYDPAAFNTNLILDMNDVQVGKNQNTYVSMEGVPPGLTFTVEEGSTLPAGLSLAENGLLSGIPTEEGSFNFTLKASAGQCVKTDPFTMQIVCPTMDIVSTELSSGVFNQPYSDKVQESISNNATVYTFTAPADSVPAGLTLAANGAITATKAKAVGTFVIPMTLHLGNCPTVTKPVTITLACPTIAISSTALQGARVGRAFAKSLAAMNGQEPYQFSLINDTSLPSGLSMDADGLIMGTPAEGTGNQLYNFDVKVVDANNCEATKSTIIYVEIATAAGDLKLATFNAYPNPVLDGKMKVQLVNDQNAPVTLQLVDLKGNVLYQTEVAKGEQLMDQVISMSGFAPGMYFLRAICDNKSASMQIVVR